MHKLTQTKRKSGLGFRPSSQKTDPSIFYSVHGLHEAFLSYNIRKQKQITPCRSLTVSATSEALMNRVCKVPDCLDATLHQLTASAAANKQSTLDWIHRNIRYIDGKYVSRSRLF